MDEERRKRLLRAREEEARWKRMRGLAENNVKAPNEQPKTHHAPSNRHTQSTLHGNNTVKAKDNAKKKEACFTLLSEKEFCIRNPDPEMKQLLHSLCAKKTTGESYAVSLDRYHRFSMLAKKLPPVRRIPDGVLQIVADNTRQGNIDISRIGAHIFDALYSFQRTGIEEAVRRDGRILLADDMGLGKTVQALGIAKYYFEEWPLLIVCPAGLIGTWKENVSRWYGDVPCVVQIITKSSDKPAGDIVVVGYPIAAKISDSLEFFRFGVVVFDESHMLKNHEAKRTRCLLPVAQMAKRAVLLSGTPSPSRPIELFPQLNALLCDAFPSLHEYGERYCGGGKTNDYGQLEYRGATNQKELQLALKKIMVRRSKDALEDSLPPKRRRLAYMNTSAKERSLLDCGSIESDFAQKEALVRMWKSVFTVKFNSLVAFILARVSREDPGIVFLHHLDAMAAFERCFIERGIKFIKIDGGTDTKKRQDICEAFQAGEEVIFLVSITAGSTGLTLTRARQVFFAELYWNPGVLLQAEDRVYRIGQTRSVEIYYFVLRGTIDEQIWCLVKRKTQMIKDVGLGAKVFEKIDSFDLDPMTTFLDNHVERLA
eukprot:GHVN01095498.1.p1 GENE.GHVN01095498.1~~GHVN01095498.1.p1  ORF type:complete len:598 (-),score=53.62 GHVN01095498.1:34-1827(-)